MYSIILIRIHEQKIQDYVFIINNIKDMQDQQIIRLFPEDKQLKRCGCYIVRPQVIGLKYRNALVPLRHIDYQLNIVNSLVNINIVQKYYNPIEKFLEVQFAIPLNPNSCIHKFVAQFNNVKIEGIVKEKEQAKKQFQKAKSQGRQAVIGTIDPNSKDILSLEIGNIPPKTEFTVTISLIQQLKVSMSMFYKLQIPCTISPRYMNKVQGIVKAPQYIQNKSQFIGQSNFRWSFKIQLRTEKSLVFFDSPSHNIKLISQNQKATQTVLVMQNSQKPNKDFDFLYTTENFHLPSYVIGSTDTSSSLMLSFIPKFSDLQITDAYKASIQDKPYDISLDTVKADYVFFLDRSGSMSGKRIQKAKQALILFLKSLPEDSYFNIISFGNTSQRIFNQGQKNNSAKIQQVIHKVQFMNADLGGTQIYEPLKQILNQKIIEGYPRQIFLLTDGEVSNTQGVINLVKKNIKYSRVHTIGIGSGASYDLIQGCAEAGKGKYTMISDGQNPSQKIIELLQASLSPIISKIDLKCDKQTQIESIVPNPKLIPYILKDEAINFYITFKGPLKQKRHFTFEYEDPIKKIPLKTSIQVEESNNNNNIQFVDKMSHFKVLRSLQNLAVDGKSVQQQLYYVKIKDYKQEAIKYSIKHQVLSEFTAFVCIGKQLVDGQYQQFKNKGYSSIYIQQPKIQEKIVLQPYFAPMGYAQPMPQRAGTTFYNSPPPLTTNMRSMAPPMGAGMSFFSQPQSQGFSNYNYSNFNNNNNNIPTSYTSTSASLSSSLRPDVHHLPQCPPPPPTSMFSSDMDDIPPPLSFYSRVMPAQKRHMPQQAQFDLLDLRQDQPRRVLKKQSQSSTHTFNASFGVNQVVKAQQADGSWTNQQLINKLAANVNLVLDLSKQYGVQIVVTKLVVLWMQKNYPQKQYSLIIKKANTWLKKNLALKSIQDSILYTIQPI